MGRLKQIGFTHVLGLGADNGRFGRPASRPRPPMPETVAQTKHMLDEALANDMTIVASLSPASMLAEQARVPARGSQGPALSKTEIDPTSAG